MSADNRQVATDALATLGTIIDESAGRDAIHLAVEPAVAAHSLLPGEHVGVSKHDGPGRLYGRTRNPVGIVDPFIKGAIKPGERFWLVVYPRQITSLRHVWTHPAFDEADGPPIPKAPQADRAYSEAWLRSFISNADCPDYDTVIAAARKCDDDDCLYFDGEDAHGEIPDEFWVHVGVVTGQTIKHRPGHFSCSC